MSKLEFLKGMLAMGLAITSFVPAVGATKSDNEEDLSQPPKKIVKRMGNDGESKLLDGSNDIESEFIKIYEVISYFVYFHSKKETREYVRRAPKESCSMQAMNYMFDYYEGKEKFDSEKIISSLDALIKSQYKKDALIDEMEGLIGSDILKLNCEIESQVKEILENGFMKQVISDYLNSTK